MDSPEGIRQLILRLCDTPDLQRELGFQLSKLMWHHGQSVDSYMMRFQCAVAPEDILEKALSATINSGASP